MSGDVPGDLGARLHRSHSHISSASQLTCDVSLSDEELGGEHSARRLLSNCDEVVAAAPGVTRGGASDLPRAPSQPPRAAAPSSLSAATSPYDVSALHTELARLQLALQEEEAAGAARIAQVRRLAEMEAEAKVRSPVPLLSQAARWHTQVAQWHAQVAGCGTLAVFFFWFWTRRRFLLLSVWHKSL